MTGTDVITYAREKPGMSTFVLEEGVVYHAYSAYARGLDGLCGAYQWLDRPPRGATRTATGGAATTSTPRAQPLREYRYNNRAAPAEDRRLQTAPPAVRSQRRRRFTY